MTKPLPPLNALRAFEAAARCQSVTKAAEELHVTPAAVSHQIQQLETDLGAKLFRRRHRRIELTDAAQVFFPKLQEGFSSLRQAVDRVRDFRSTDVLTIAGAPSFTSRWLMPRLHRFVIAHPDIDVRVGTRVRQFLGPARQQSGDAESVSAWVNEVDVVIAYGNGNYPGLQVDELLPLTVTPLCSPDLVRVKPLRKPADLLRHVLLHDDRGTLYEDRPYLQVWLAAAGLDGAETKPAMHFTHAILAFEAAADGLGVTVSTPELAGTDIALGRLVAPFAMRAPISPSYYLVSSEAAARREIVQTFRAWLLEEATLQLRTKAVRSRSVSPRPR